MRSFSLRLKLHFPSKENDLMSILPQLRSVLSSLYHRGLISGPQQKFVLHLLLLWPSVRGRYNLLNLSRYSSYHEHSFRRHFGKEFAWGAFNAALIQALVPCTHELMLAQDASFVRKSGKKTCGLGRFYNGCAQRPERGLELSLVSVIDLSQNTAYALHVKQSLPQAKAKAQAKTKAQAKAKAKTKAQAKAKAQAKTKAQAKAQAQAKAVECPHLQHLRETQEHWPAGATFLAVDGAYARQNFVGGACALGVHVVSRLRSDANVRTLYTGPQKPRGAKKLYDEKLRWKQLDLTLWNDEGELEPGLRLYSLVVNHVSLKRNIKIALLIRDNANSKAHHTLLFCTDLHSSGRDIVRRYRARFHIEFLFRDAKSGAGLLHCQTTTAQALAFAWNTSLAAVNLAKLNQWNAQSTRFSWASTHQKCANEHLLQLFCSKLDLDWSYVQSHPQYQSLVNYGAIAA
jgi:hypothetical protein